MPRTEDKATLTVPDIWQAYVKKLLAANPEYITRRGKSATANCYVLRPSGEGAEIAYTEVMNYFWFRRLIEHYFNKAKIAIIAGEALNILGSVGKICARRVERDFTSYKQQQVDWGKTSARGWTINPETGKRKYNKVILITSTDWCRIGWHKPKDIYNAIFYQFAPASANAARTLGFQLEFSQALDKDPLLRYQYLYMPRSNRKAHQKRRELDEQEQQLNKAI